MQVSLEDFLVLVDGLLGADLFAVEQVELDGIPEREALGLAFDESGPRLLPDLVGVASGAAHFHQERGGAVTGVLGVDSVRPFDLDAGGLAGHVRLYIVALGIAVGDDHEALQLDKPANRLRIDTSISNGIEGDAKTEGSDAYVWMPASIVPSKRKHLARPKAQNEEHSSDERSRSSFRKLLKREVDG